MVLYQMFKPQKNITISVPFYILKETQCNCMIYIEIIYCMRYIDLYIKQYNNNFWYYILTATSYNIINITACLGLSKESLCQ